MPKGVLETLDILRTMTMAERAVALRVVVVALLIPIYTRRLSLPDLVGRLDAPPAGSCDIPIPRLVWLVRGVLARKIGPIAPGCYRESLILFHLLRRSGRAATIVFGIRREGDDLAGHSWVELAGRPVAEPGDPRDRFKVTYAYPGESLD